MQIQNIFCKTLLDYWAGVTLVLKHCQQKLNSFLLVLKISSINRINPLNNLVCRWREECIFTISNTVSVMLEEVDCAKWRFSPFHANDKGLPTVNACAQHTHLHRTFHDFLDLFHKVPLRFLPSTQINSLYPAEGVMLKDLQIYMLVFSPLYFQVRLQIKWTIWHQWSQHLMGNGRQPQ